MTPRCTTLMEAAGLETPVIGLYDTPDPEAFSPLREPAQGKWACMFMFYNSWTKGESLHLTPENYGCGGCGTYLLGQKTRDRQEYIDFLYHEEGLKASPELMGAWIDQTTPYHPEHDHLVIGPLREEAIKHLITVTFFVTPDQLSLFVTGAHYHQGGNYPPRVTAPFGSGCGLLAPAFQDLEKPAAVLGATDIAMRKYLPPNLLAFTVTVPLYQELCALDEHSFLSKPFWKKVQQARSRG